MKKTIIIPVLLSLFIIWGSNIKALTPEGLSLTTEMSEDWTLDQSTSNVDFYYRIDNCNGEKAVLLRIVNRNDFEVQVNWKEFFTDANTRRTMEGFASEKELTLAAGRTIEARNCSDYDKTECLILSSMVSPTRVVRIQDFEFRSITVNAVR
ncbi:MAG: hypothetical protein EA361_15875 [Bacteroidetes bacterium]|nr:MAG: hypothetical protein EA361_15875 [Bacteroidota bacterium]